MHKITKVITLCVDAEFLKAIDRQAAFSHMNRSEYIRAAIRKSLETDFEMYS